VQSILLHQGARRHSPDRRDATGNLPSLPALFPTPPAPVVRRAEDRMPELTVALGMASRAFALKGRSKEQPNLT
jgi:hypothetical protein